MSKYLDRAERLADVLFLLYPVLRPKNPPAPNGTKPEFLERGIRR